MLDEPLNGTDPVQRAHLIRMFKSLAKEGRTIIVSSHMLNEVERMADRVVAMVDGRLAGAGPSKHYGVPCPTLHAGSRSRPTIHAL